MLVAACTIGTLLLVVLFMQFAPPRRVPVAALPAVQPTRTHAPDSQLDDTSRHPSQSRPAAKLPPLSEVLPPVVPPDNDDWMDQEAGAPVVESVPPGGQTQPRTVTPPQPKKASARAHTPAHAPTAATAKHPPVVVPV